MTNLIIGIANDIIKGIQVLFNYLPLDSFFFGTVFTALNYFLYVNCKFKLPPNDEIKLVYYIK